MSSGCLSHGAREAGAVSSWPYGQAQLMRHLEATAQLAGLGLEEWELQCLWTAFNYGIFDTYKNTSDQEAPM